MTKRDCEKLKDSYNPQNKIRRYVNPVSYNGCDLLYFRLFDGWRLYVSRQLWLTRFQNTKNERLRKDTWKIWRSVNSYKADQKRTFFPTLFSVEKLREQCTCPV